MAGPATSFTKRKDEHGTVYVEAYAAVCTLFEQTVEVGLVAAHMPALRVAWDALPGDLVLDESLVRQVRIYEEPTDG